MKTVEFYNAKESDIDLPFQFHFVCGATKEENSNFARNAASKANLRPNEVNYVVGFVRTHGESISKLASSLGLGGTDQLLLKLTHSDHGSKDAAFTSDVSKAQPSIDNFVKSHKKK